MVCAVKIQSWHCMVIDLPIHSILCQAHQSFSWLHRLAAQLTADCDITSSFCSQYKHTAYLNTNKRDKNELTSQKECSVRFESTIYMQNQKKAIEIQYNTAFANQMYSHQGNKRAMKTKTKQQTWYYLFFFP